MFSKEKSKPFVAIQVVLIVIVLAFVIWLATQVGTNPEVREVFIKLGYPGMFILAMISGFNVIVPIPAILLAPIFVEAGLNLWLLIIVASIGMTVGDIIGFFLGKVGRNVTSNKKMPVFIEKIELWLNKYKYGSSIFMFLYAAFAPIPNEVVVVPLSFSGAKFKQLFWPVFLGNLLFNIYVGHGFVTLISFL